MTVCRYYLQGTCRFGDRCRFEHTDTNYSQESYGYSNRRQDYGFQDRYRQHGSYSDQHRNTDHDLSFGPRRYNTNERQNQNYYQPSYNYYNQREHFKRYDTYDNQNQDYERETYDQSEHYDSDTKYGQTHRYDSYNKSKQRSDANKFSSNERYDSKSHFDGFHKQRQAETNYRPTKFDRSQYEWTSEDYKRKQEPKQLGQTYGETPKSQVQFSFKELDKDVHKESVGENTLVLADIIKEDVTAWELGKQWPLTCYFPFRDKQGFPGFNDVSFEELRYEALKAKENNSFNSYIEFVEKAIIEVNNKRNLLKEPTAQLLSAIEKLSEGESIELAVSDGFSVTNFDQTGTDDITADDSPFHPQTTAASFSFKTSLNSTPVKNIASSFSFKLPQGDITPTAPLDSDIYTSMEQLSEEDRMQFSASTFTLGKIPTVPPPRLMCL